MLLEKAYCGEMTEKELKDGGDHYTKSDCKKAKKLAKEMDVFINGEKEERRGRPKGSKNKQNKSTEKASDNKKNLKEGGDAKTDQPLSSSQSTVTAMTKNSPKKASAGDDGGEHPNNTEGMFSHLFFCDRELRMLLTQVFLYDFALLGELKPKAKENEDGPSSESNAKEKENEKSDGGDKEKAAAAKPTEKKKHKSKKRTKDDEDTAKSRSKKAKTDESKEPVSGGRQKKRGRPKRFKEHKKTKAKEGEKDVAV